MSDGLAEAFTALFVVLCVVGIMFVCFGWVATAYFLTAAIMPMDGPASVVTVAAVAMLSPLVIWAIVDYARHSRGDRGSGGDRG